MMTAVSESAGEASARRNSVVLPLPRKPVSTVVGSVCASGTLVNHSVVAQFRPQSFHDPAAAASSAGKTLRWLVKATSAIAFSHMRQQYACHKGAALAAIAGRERKCGRQRFR